MDNNQGTNRNISTETGIEYSLKYIDDASLITNYNQQEFRRKECVYCKDVDLKIKDKLDNPKYILNNTSHSLFDGHQLLFAKTHAGEYLTGSLRFLLDFLDTNKEATLAYDGNKNAPIKNYHFTCHVLNKEIKLPLIQSCSNRDFYKIINTKDGIELGELEHYGRGAIILKGSDKETITKKLYELEKHIGVNYANNEHPYINLYIWIEDAKYCMALVPRSVFKPREYYDENNTWDTAIGSLEMGGLFLLSNHDEFMHTSADFLTKLCNEVSFNDEHIKEIIRFIE